MFSIPHILFIIFSFVFAECTAKYYENKCSEDIEKFLKICALMSVCFDPLYWVWEWNKFGSLNLATTLPLYICSLFWIMMPIAALAKHDIIKRTAISTICTVCLIGGVMGIVFNVYVSDYPIYSFIPARSLIYHLLMITVADVLWKSGYYEPERKDCLLCFTPVIALLIICSRLNKRFGWDYCYTAGGIGTPFEIISGRLPKPMFLFVIYGGLFLIIFLMFYRKLFQNKENDGFDFFNRFDLFK